MRKENMRGAEPGEAVPHPVFSAVSHAVRFRFNWIQFKWKAETGVYADVRYAQRTSVSDAGFSARRKMVSPFSVRFGRMV